MAFSSWAPKKSARMIPATIAVGRTPVGSSCEKRARAWALASNEGPGGGGGGGGGEAAPVLVAVAADVAPPGGGGGAAGSRTGGAGGAAGGGGGGADAGAGSLVGSCPTGWSGVLLTVAECTSPSRLFAVPRRVGCNNPSVANRQQRRQGVVYGPVRQNGPRSSAGALIGRILGLLVLVMATGLLAVGALAFVGGGAATPSPRSTLAAGPSFRPSLSALPSVSPTSGATPDSATPSASSGASDEPLPTAPLISVGPGFVTFGTKVDRELKVTNPRTEFTKDERIVWSAYLIDPADASALRVLVLKSEASAPGGERLIVDEEVAADVSPAQIFVRRLRPRRYLDGPGLYVVRYLRGDRLLAEGHLLVTE